MSFDVELQWVIQTTALFVFSIILQYQIVELHPFSITDTLWCCEQCTFTATDELVGGLKQACTIRLNQAAAVEMAYTVTPSLSHIQRGFTYEKD